ncbi:lanthionine synthetase LanC family protein [Primorskyibacter sp. 2E107]|uniref:lanthionine synthetase LanC family protein n=1 Tax=Primorskyibacter sp. 2E107 TaxID=3403458 RepID=UPI003AF668BA
MCCCRAKTARSPAARSSSCWLSRARKAEVVRSQVVSGRSVGRAPKCPGGRIFGQDPVRSFQHTGILMTLHPVSNPTEPRWTAMEAGLSHALSADQRRAESIRLAVDVLDIYCAGGGADRCGHDAGPVLAAVALHDMAPDKRGLVEAALLTWLESCPQDFAGIGPFGGLSGFLAALRAARRVIPSIDGLYRDVCARTPEALAAMTWRSSDVSWRDYDYFMGPSGVIIAGSSEDTAEHMVRPALDHLAALCVTPGFEAFRAGDDIDPRSAFNIGRINAGLGHGLAGVCAALIRAMRVFSPDPGRQAALRRLCDWLEQEMITDALGLMTWPPVGSDGGPQPTGFNARQAWCYGAPGNAWVLFDGATVLGDTRQQDRAVRAMQSFCARFDADLYIDDAGADDALSLCHGAAGTLITADAFARHAGLNGAAALRDALVEYVLARREAVLELATGNMSLLSGAGGIAAILLTAAGADRGWLHHLTLR